MDFRRQGARTSRWPWEERLSARCSPTRSEPMGTAPTRRRRWTCSCASRRSAGERMATYRILYWQEVPSQIKAEDALDEVTVALAPRFMERIDQLAGQRGLQGSDEYLAQWQWSEEIERPGSADEVAEAVRAELESQWP